MDCSVDLVPSNHATYRSANIWCSTWLTVDTEKSEGNPLTFLSSEYRRFFPRG